MTAPPPLEQHVTPEPSAVTRTVALAFWVAEEEWLMPLPAAPDCFAVNMIRVKRLAADAVTGEFGLAFIALTSAATTLVNVSAACTV